VTINQSKLNVTRHQNRTQIFGKGFLQRPQQRKWTFPRLIPDILTATQSRRIRKKKAFNQ